MVCMASLSPYTHSGPPLPGVLHICALGAPVPEAPRSGGNSQVGHRWHNALPAHAAVVPAPSSGGLRPGCRRGPHSTREPVRSCTPPTAPCRRNLTRSIPPAGRTGNAPLRHCQGRPLQRPHARFGWCKGTRTSTMLDPEIHAYPRPRARRRKGCARGPL